MQDSELVQLYWTREQSAIDETQRKYGSFCHSISWNILKNHEDTEECLNDTWLTAWNQIPPTRPVSFRAYIGKLVRSKSIDCWRRNHTGKRRGSQLELALEELSDCLPSREDSPEQIILEKDLSRIIRDLLSEQREIEQQVFLLRYWYFMPESKIALHVGMTRGGVSAMLTRTRKKLKKQLILQGVYFNE